MKINSRTNPAMVFNITPIGKPRLVHSDIWSKRPAVNRWYAYKDELVLLARKAYYEVTDEMDIVFMLPMPDSWSKKKKEKMLTTPHIQKPDLDNLLKAFMDSLTDHDEGIHTIRAKKIWGIDGQIAIF